MNVIIGWLVWVVVDLASLGALAPPAQCDMLDGKHITDCGIEVTLDATWPQHLHDDAAQLIECESNGNTRAYNGSDPFGGSRGLFQINGVHRARYAGQDIHDPVVNARVAYAIYREQGRNAWWRCVRRHNLFTE